MRVICIAKEVAVNFNDRVIIMSKKLRAKVTIDTNVVNGNAENG